MESIGMAKIHGYFTSSFHFQRSDMFSTRLQRSRTQQLGVSFFRDTVAMLVRLPFHGLRAIYCLVKTYHSGKKRIKQAARQCAFGMPTWRQRGRRKTPRLHHSPPDQFQRGNSHVACRCKPPALSLLGSILAHSGLAIYRYTVSIESIDQAQAVSQSCNAYTHQPI